MGPSVPLSSTQNSQMYGSTTHASDEGNNQPNHNINSVTNNSGEGSGNGNTNNINPSANANSQVMDLNFDEGGSQSGHENGPQGGQTLPTLCMVVRNDPTAV